MSAGVSGRCKSNVVEWLPAEHYTRNARAWAEVGAKVDPGRVTTARYDAGAPAMLVSSSCASVFSWRRCSFGQTSIRADSCRPS